MSINLHPTVCNICGGHVIYTSNANVYGKEYGSGFCYLCKDCGAYVGTHKPRPTEALGILSTDEMKRWKIRCHRIFDRVWLEMKETKHRNRRQNRTALYEWLAIQMDIPQEDCHFGYFDTGQLMQAYDLLIDIVGMRCYYEKGKGLQFYSRERKKPRKINMKNIVEIQF